MGTSSTIGRARHRAATPWSRFWTAAARHRLSVIAGLAAVLAVSVTLTAPAVATGPTLPAGYTVNGIDVSGWQGSAIAWSTVKANAKFVYAKATEGTTYVNPSFVSQYTGAKAAGLFVGAYAFGRPDSPALAQADYFLDNARFAADGKTLPPMLDMEWPYTSGSSYVAPYPCWGLTPADMVAWIRSFVAEVKRRTGSATLIYTNRNWWNPCTGSTTAFGDELLDVASYTAAPPATLPTSWPSWTLWQYANHGSLPGDQNVFSGTLAQLTALAASTGCKRVPSDFNGDGLADTAIGEPRRGVGIMVGAGAVEIAYAGAQGLDSTTMTYLDQSSSGVPGSPVPNGRFGATVASGYFNNDCYADLAIAAPGSGNGTVTVLYGSPKGLVTAGAGILTGRSAGSRFGTALASGDVNDDGHADLVIGAPGAAAGAGEIAIAHGGASALGAVAAWINEATSGVPGNPAAGDAFGASLAVADFSGDRVADIAIGAPGATVGSVRTAGSVIVVKGSKAALGAGAQAWSQSSTGVGGTAASGDNFGAALAAGDVTADGRADLAVGAPGDTIGSTAHEGSVTLFDGVSAGLTAAGSQVWDQDVTGVPGTGAANDHFGAALAMGDFNGNGHADLAIGVPNSTVSTVENVGTVVVLYGGSSGLTVTGARSWVPGETGVPGTASTFGHFGSALRAATISSGYASLVIGAPSDLTPLKNTEGTITVVPGSASGLTTSGVRRYAEPQSPTQSVSHVVTHNDAFGASLG